MTNFLIYLLISDLKLTKLMSLKVCLTFWSRSVAFYQVIKFTNFIQIHKTFLIKQRTEWNGKETIKRYTEASITLIAAHVVVCSAIEIILMFIYIFPNVS